MSSPHVWQFFRAGGVDQVVIREGADIAHLRELDQKLWVALACPTRGVEFDTRTLDLIDTDHDGRIRAPELIAACEWAVQRLRDPDELVRPGDTLALDALADEPRSDAQGTPAVALTEAARRILAVRGKAESDRLSLADVTDRAELLAAQRFNGDGVVTLDSSDDAPLRELIGLIAATQGSLPDRGGKDGVDRARADAFFAQADALQAWQAARGDADLAALDGDAAQAATRSIEAVRAKVDDFFTRCRLADYDARAATALTPTVEALERLGQQTLHDRSEELARLPLAAIRPAGELPLRAGLNPAWAAAIDALPTPSRGSTASRRSASIAAAQAGLRPARSGSSPAGRIAARGRRASSSL
ncbi:MAG: hypothetical protein EOO22_02425, partial [Comamonadaceae bacterium]